MSLLKKGWLAIILLSTTTEALELSLGGFAALSVGHLALFGIVVSFSVVCKLKIRWFVHKCNICSCSQNEADRTKDAEGDLQMSETDSGLSAGAFHAANMVNPQRELDSSSNVGKQKPKQRALRCNGSNSNSVQKVEKLLLVVRFLISLMMGAASLPHSLPVQQLL